MSAESQVPEVPSWREPAHPSAQLVARESLAALERLAEHLNALDTKASFLAAGAFALVAGFMAGIAAKPPSNPHLQDAAVVALAIDLLALAPILYTWWPRSFDFPPHPRGLREHHFNDREENVLLAISNQIATTYDDNVRIAKSKSNGIRIAMLTLFLGAALSAVVFGVDILQGVTH